MHRVLVVAIVTVIIGGVTTAVVQTSSGRPGPAATAAPRVTPTLAATVAPSISTSTSSASSTTSTPSTLAPAAPRPAPAPIPSALRLAGCPPPARALGPTPPSPWHPAVLVPESSLPSEQAAAPWASDVDAITGKGMWVWEWDRTEHGNAAAVVQRAEQAGLRQLWVRVADSRNGFYGAPRLDALVGKAHDAGLTVIAWGFPYLYDPMGDAAWTTQILDWRGGAGDHVDGYSADIERASEGVALSERRAITYLAAVRRAAGSRLIVATVYPPLDGYRLGAYPYAAIARYVDAFAPMIYWECTDPGVDAAQALGRLAGLRPVHLIGQAYNMAGEGGRAVSPSGQEIRRFLDVGRRAGAVGASFWVWQSATDEEWQAVAAYPWPG